LCHYKKNDIKAAAQALPPQNSTCAFLMIINGSLGRCGIQLVFIKLLPFLLLKSAQTSLCQTDF
jgi:hypothetical protein